MADGGRRLQEDGGGGQCHREGGTCSVLQMKPVCSVVPILGHLSVL